MTGTHTHDHGPHLHLHPESYPHVHGGPVVLDIGGDIGALIARTDDAALGTEIHLRSEDRPTADVHTGVWERTVSAGRVTAAVFAELLEGWYWVLDDRGRDVRRVEVRGGQLTTLDLRP